MRSVWRINSRGNRSQPSARPRRTRPRLCARAARCQTLLRMPPIFGDSTFINDTIRREHSPPGLGYE